MTVRRGTEKTHQKCPQYGGLPPRFSQKSGPAIPAPPWCPNFMKKKLEKTNERYLRPLKTDTFFRCIFFLMCIAE